MALSGTFMPVSVLPLSVFWLKLSGILYIKKMYKKKEGGVFFVKVFFSRFHKTKTNCYTSSPNAMCLSETLSEMVKKC